MSGNVPQALPLATCMTTFILNGSSESEKSQARLNTSKSSHSLDDTQRLPDAEGITVAHRPANQVRCEVQPMPASTQPFVQDGSTSVSIMDLEVDANEQRPSETLSNVTTSSAAAGGSTSTDANEGTQTSTPQSAVVGTSNTHAESWTTNQAEGTVSETELDEEALMAQAIALSLSSAQEEVEEQAHALGKETQQSAQANQSPAVKIIPKPYSAEEILSLPGLNLLAYPHPYVPSYAVVNALLASIYRQACVYMDMLMSGDAEVPHTTPAIHPHPLTFLLIQSLMAQLHHAFGEVQADTSGMEVDERLTTGSSLKDPGPWKIFRVCGSLSLLQLLEANFFHVEMAGLQPASVGLGHVHGELTGTESFGNPLPHKIKEHVQRFLDTEVSSGHGKVRGEDEDFPHVLDTSRTDHHCAPLLSSMLLCCSIFT